MSQNPGYYGPDQPLTWSPAEYGYESTIEPYFQADGSDNPNQVLLGATPVTPTGSPFTYTNSDPKNAQQVFVNGDSNMTLNKNGTEYAQHGAFYITLNPGQFFRVSYVRNPDIRVLTLQGRTDK